MGAEETQEYHDAVRGTHVVVLGVRGGKLINCAYDVPLGSNNFLYLRTTSYFQITHFVLYK